MAARSIEAGDGQRLYHVIDERARHALISIAASRREAAQVIERDYPEAERGAALRALGDAADAADGAELFARRCGRPCMAAIAARLGAPVAQRRRGDVTVIKTAQGGELELYHGSDGWWGLVWNTQALSDERSRAARELAQVRENAAIYRRRRTLEAGNTTKPGTSSEGSAVGSSK